MPLLETQEGWILNDPEQNMELKKDFNSAICVQKVDAHMSCSSHSDAQLAAFFIDPRAKWSTVECYIHLVASISAFKRKHSTTVFTAQTGVSTKPKKSGVGTYAVQNRILYPLTESWGHCTWKLWPQGAKGITGTPTSLWSVCRARQTGQAPLSSFVASHRTNPRVCSHISH